MEATHNDPVRPCQLGAPLEAGCQCDGGCWVGGTVGVEWGE